MQMLTRIMIPRIPPSYLRIPLSNPRLFSTWDGVPTDTSWSTGLTKDQFDGQAVGHQVTPPPPPPPPHTPPNPSSPTVDNAATGPPSQPQGASSSSPGKRQGQQSNDIEKEARRMVEAWEKRELEVWNLLKQIEVPGARGSYLKDKEKAEIYKKHKQNPEVHTVEKLAHEYCIMRQRVHAILWLKEEEEKEEKKRGEPLDDSVEQLIDGFPNFFNSHDREFHVASLPYRPDFKVMPEGWDGTTRDPDEVHYELSKKEDDIMYEEFVEKFDFNTMKINKQVKVHKYSRRRPSNGWEFIVSKLGPQGKLGTGGAWKFASLPDGSTRPLNNVEKMFAKRETPRRRRKYYHNEPRLSLSKLKIYS